MYFTFLEFSPAELPVSTIDDMLGYVREFLAEAPKDKATYKQANLIRSAVHDVNITYYVSNWKVPEGYDQFIMIFRPRQMAFLKYVLQYELDRLLPNERLIEILTTNKGIIEQSRRSNTDFMYSMTTLSDGTLKEIDSIIKGLEGFVQ